MPDAPTDVVVDASVIVDLVAVTVHAPAARTALAGRRLFAPAHLDAEVISALGHMQRAGLLTARQATNGLKMCARTPIDRAPLPDLLAGAWRRRSSLRVSDALYVELAEQLGLELVTTDRRLGRSYPAAQVVGVSS